MNPLLAGLVMTGLLVLVVVALVIALMSARSTRLERERHIRQVGGARAASRRSGTTLEDLHPTTWLDRIGIRSRAVFAFGLARTWGMRTSPLTLLLASGIGSCLGWLALYSGLGMSSWVAGRRGLRVLSDATVPAQARAERGRAEVHRAVSRHHRHGDQDAARRRAGHRSRPLRGQRGRASGQRRLHQPRRSDGDRHHVRGRAGHGRRACGFARLQVLCGRRGPATRNRWQPRVHPRHSVGHHAQATRDAPEGACDDR